MAQDYYELLGVERGAEAGEIKRAFRKRARELHPDVNPSPEAEEQFRQITAAYEVLSDDERRQIYDRYGEDGLKQRHWEPHFASFGNIADIFSAFFGDDIMGAMRGRGAAGARQARGENVIVSMQLEFADAALGTRREVSYEAVGQCATCEGRGAESEEGLAPCDQCSGTGVLRTVARSLFGQVIQEQACPRCAGRGQMITDPCATCHGTGERPDHHTITVDVPAGIADGQRIRLSGRGSVGAFGGPPGNLYLDVHVKDDERFLREGDDLVTVVDLTFGEAALGCVKPVDTVDGEPAQVEFEAGVQPGEVLTVRGKGVGRLRGGGGRGDLRIVISVLVPRELTADQRELLARFRATEVERNYRSGESLMDKLRRVLRT